MLAMTTYLYELISIVGSSGILEMSVLTFSRHSWAYNVIVLATHALVGAESTQFIISGCASKNTKKKKKKKKRGFRY